MRRLLPPLLLSVAGTILSFVGAAMYGGMCHCETAMFTLFPFGAYAMMRMGWDSLGLLLVLVQFPLYAVITTVVTGARRRVIVLLVIVALHVLAASFALHDYCGSRRTCTLASPNSWGSSQELVDVNVAMANTNARL